MAENVLITSGIVGRWGPGAVVARECFRVAEARDRAGEVIAPERDALPALLALGVVAMTDRPITHDARGDIIAPAPAPAPPTAADSPPKAADEPKPSGRAPRKSASA